jgi:hypothetical protein
MHGDFACFFSEQAFQRLSNIFHLLLERRFSNLTRSKNNLFIACDGFFCFLLFCCVVFISKMIVNSINNADLITEKKRRKEEEEEIS